MRILLIVLIIVLANAQLAFKPLNQPAMSTQNDTTEAIRLSIQRSFFKHTMPEAEYLLRNNKSGDSILFTSEKKLLKYLPGEVDSLKFRIIESKDICALLAADTTWKKRHYLRLQLFERKNNTYEVVLSNMNCDRFTSGGGIGVTLIKKADSLKITHVGAFNIN
ncbi:hypothetical protein [Ferruginibacter sp.]